MELDFFITLTLLTGVLPLISAWIAYRRSHDTFHPMIYLGLLCVAFYCWIPLNLVLNDSTGLLIYLSVQQMEQVQWLHLLGVTSLCAGVLTGSKSLRWNPHTLFWRPVSDITAKRIDTIAIVMGLLGLACFLYGIASVGGLEAAYGRAYGGGWSETGYIRDAAILTLPAILWLMVSHIHRRFTYKEIAWILAFAAPNLIHGLLGARRGPTVLILVAIAVGWYMVRNRRPKLFAVIGAGISLGMLMLFLVSNRGSIYVGSHQQVKGLEDSTEFLSKASSGNEFIYASGVTLDTNSRQRYFWGARYFVVFFIRPIPRFIWKNKYQDASEILGIPNLEINLGLGTSSLKETVGWEGAAGASPGIITDLWVEFWWYSLIVLYLIGWLYAWAWRKAVTIGGIWIPNYVIMTALSVYLITQTLEAIAVRYLIASAGSWLIWKYANRKNTSFENIEGD